MPEIQIRPALETDIPALTSLDHSYVSEHVWQMELQHEAGSTGALFREVRLPRAVRVEYPRSTQSLTKDWQSRSAVLVATLLGGEPIGYASLIKDLIPYTTWMTDLVVTQLLRRQGIGSALVVAGLDWAERAANSRRLILEMQPKNYPAISLAQRLGFDFCGYLDHYYPNHDIAILFEKWMV